MAQPSHREKLIKGSIRCLQTKGYARTTARDIAEETGANLASIGYHFGSKEALLDEALVRIFEQRNRRIGQLTLAAEDASPAGRLTAMFVAVTETFKAHRPLLVAFVEAMAQVERSPDLRERIAAHYRDARRAVGETIHVHLAGTKGLNADAEVVGALLIALFDGLVLQSLLDADATPDGSELVDALKALGALAAKETTP